MERKGSIWVTALVIVLAVALLVAISVPNLLRSRMASDEASYVAKLRQERLARLVSEESPTDAKLQPVSLRDADPERKLIRTAELNLQVTALQSVVKQVHDIAAESGGYVEESTVDGEAQHGSGANLKLRVPANRLDETISRLKQLAVRIDHEGIEAKDVTREYIDLDARFRNLQAEEQQYLVILKRASTVKDTLDVTQHISDVRGQIEQLQAQLKYLSHQIEMSSISLNLHMNAAATLSAINWKPSLTARNALHDLGQGLADWADVLLSLLIELPLILLWVCTIGAAALIIWKPSHFLWRRFRKPQTMPQSAQTD
jgi:Domain of unknown function (DUF4349)